MKRLAPTLLIASTIALMFLVACGGAAEQPPPTTAPSGQTPAATSPPAAQPTTAAAQPTAQPTTAPQGNAPQPKNPAGTIVFAQSNLGCNPGAHSVFCAQYDAVTWGVGEDVFTWRWQADGTIDYAYPQLAVKWDMSPDFRSVVIETRQGVQFHKGYGEMTAEDVAHTYNGVNPLLTSHSIAPSASYFSTLFGSTPAEVLDSNHVRFTFATIDSHWHTYMMNTNGFVGTVVHPKRGFDENGEDWMRDNFIGTGAFEVESWVRDDRAVFVRFDQHWEHKPQIQRVIIQAMPEDASRLAAMQTGELDAVELALKSVPLLLRQGFASTSSGNAAQQGLVFSGNLWEDKHALTGEPLNTARSGVYARDIEWIGNPYSPNDGNNPQALACGPGDDPLKDGDSCGDMEQARLVRWAVAMAIDRDAINREILNGLGWPVHIGYADEKSPYWETKWEYPYNVARANEFLDQAGFARKGGGIRFEMPLFVDTGAQGGLNEEILDAVSGMMAQIGIQSSVLKFPYAVFRPGLVERSATVPRITAGDDGQTIFPFDWPKGIEESSLSRGGYCICYETPKISEIYLKVGSEPDPQKRIELNKGYFDHQYFWALKPGIVAIPQLTLYNPNSIREWVMEPTPFGTSAFWNVVPAR